VQIYSGNFKKDKRRNSSSSNPENKDDYYVCSFADQKVFGTYLFKLEYLKWRSLNFKIRRF